MAERRMFSKTIIETDKFLELPSSVQALYFHLSMQADDDGFVSSPKKIQQMTRSRRKDLNVLIDQDYIIPFESGVIAIKHWRIHNYIRNDRYKETVYQKEKALLHENEMKAYELIDSGRHAVYQRDTQVSIGKDSIGEESLVYCSDSPEKGFSTAGKLSETKEDENATATVISFLDGTEVFVSRRELKQWQEAYPDLDVELELRRMQVWLDMHPDRQRSSGCKHFIVTWLNREAEKSKSAKAASVQNPPDPPNFDLDELFEAASTNWQKDMENQAGGDFSTGLCQT